MPTTLPTCALCEHNVPLPDGDGVIAFAMTLDGYAEAGGREALMAYLAAHSEESASLHALRMHLFVQQRRHYHQGGGWPEGDPLLDHMRALVARIRSLVVGRGSGMCVWEGDITQLGVDAIVNAANNRMLGGGGVDGAIHKAAGPGLLEACREVPEVRSGVRCPTGEARITAGFRLRAKHVIHTVGPVWRGGDQGEPEALANAYTASLALAVENGLHTIAFPGISTGVYGYPPQLAEQVATAAVARFLDATPHTLRVVFVRFKPPA